MEAILIQALTPLLGMIFTALFSWGISILKSKIKVDIARNSLDEVDRIVATVVAGLTQTMADPMKEAASDGKLSDEEKKSIKYMAIARVKSLLTQSVIEAAGRTVINLDDYINQKIEEQVLSGKSAVAISEPILDQPFPVEPTAEH